MRTVHVPLASGLPFADDRRAIARGPDRTLHLFDIESGTCLCTFAERTPMLDCCVAVLPDGRRALLADGENLSVSDLETGACLRTLKGHGDAVLGVAVLRDGRHLVSASRDKTMRIWDLETGRCVVRWDGDNWLTAVAAGPSGRLVAGDCAGQLFFFTLVGGERREPAAPQA